MAFNMISEPLYRGQGLLDAIDIAYKAQLVIGMDRIEKDKTFIRMRQRWIEFSLSSSSVRACFGPQQNELLDTLVSAYLEVDSPISAPSLQAYSTFTAPDSSKQPFAERYHDLLIEAASHLRQLKKNWVEAEKSPLLHVM